MRAAPLLLIIVVLAGCSSGEHLADSAKMQMRSEAAPMAASAAPATGGFGNGFKGADGSLAIKGRIQTVGPVNGMSDEAKTASYEPPPEAPRMIVRNGTLSLRVKDVRIAESQVRAVAKAARGSVDASQGSDLEGPTPSLSVTIRVPEPQFDAALVNLENLGTRLGKSISSEDVTSQAVDLDARLKSLRVQEDAYRAILGAAKKISDVLEVQERITGVRTEIEQIVAQRRGLGDQASRSTIVVTLSQNQRDLPPPPAKPADPNWMAQTWGDATGTLGAVGRALASFVMWLLVMSPVWLPVGLIGMLVYRRTRVAL